MTAILARDRLTLLVLLLGTTVLLVTPTGAAPVGGEDASGEVGCYHMLENYKNGDQIRTNEPCLNCTCSNNTLRCFLKTCPYTKPIGLDCIVERSDNVCCPTIRCPEVPVMIPASEQPQSIGHFTESPEGGDPFDGYESEGCTFEGVHYNDGAQIPSSSHQPCELCYCIRNRTACVFQECTLNVSGCVPQYKSGVCCPTSYNCEEPSPITTTTTTTTTLKPSEACLRNGASYESGTVVPSADKCEKCYCLHGSITCAVHDCKPPSVGCVPLETKDSCCPVKYDCSSAANVTIPVPQEKVGTNETAGVLPAIVDTGSSSNETEETATTNRPATITHVIVASHIPVFVVSEAAATTPQSSSVVSEEERGGEGQEQGGPKTETEEKEHVVATETSPTPDRQPQTEPELTTRQSPVQDYTILTEDPDLEPERIAETTTAPWVDIHEKEDTTPQESRQPSEQPSQVSREPETQTLAQDPQPTLPAYTTSSGLEVETADDRKDLEAGGLPTTEAFFVTEEEVSEEVSVTESREASSGIETKTTPATILEPEATPQLPQETPALPREEQTTVAATVTEVPVPIFVTEQDSVPGEGDCLQNGITYKSSYAMPSVDPCQVNCSCRSSLKVCERVLCDNVPSSQHANDSCVQIFEEGFCCPRYICEETQHPTGITDSHSLVKSNETEVTEAPIIVTTTHKVVISDRIDTTHHPIAVEVTTVSKEQPQSEFIPTTGVPIVKHATTQEVTSAPERSFTALVQAPFTEATLKEEKPEVVFTLEEDDPAPTLPGIVDKDLPEVAGTTESTKQREDVTTASPTREGEGIVFVAPEQEEIVSGSPNVSRADTAAPEPEVTAAGDTTQALESSTPTNELAITSAPEYETQAPEREAPSPLPPQHQTQSPKQETTLAPEHVTQAPEYVTLAPVPEKETPASPEYETESPEQEATVHEKVITFAPGEETATLEQETSAPELETVAPEQETSAPEQETSAPEDKTAAPKQQTPAPELGTVAPEREVAVPEHAIQSPEREVTVPEQGTILEHETQAPEQETILEHETQAPDQEVTIPEHETQSPEREVTIPEHETQSPEREVIASEHLTQAPEREVTVPEQTQAPEQEVIAPEHLTQSPEQEVTVPEHLTQSPEREVTVPEQTQAPEQEVIAPEHLTQSPEREVTVPDYVTQAPEREVSVPEQTQAPEQEVIVPEHLTQSPEREVTVPEQTQAPEREVTVPEHLTQSPEREITVPDYLTQAPERESPVPKHETKTPEQETEAPERETPDLEHEIHSPEQETSSQTQAPGTVTAAPEYVTSAPETKSPAPDSEPSIAEVVTLVTEAETAVPEVDRVDKEEEENVTVLTQTSIPELEPSIHEDKTAIPESVTSIPTIGGSVVIAETNQTSPQDIGTSAPESKTQTEVTKMAPGTESPAAEAQTSIPDSPPLTDETVTFTLESETFSPEKEAPETVAPAIEAQTELGDAPSTPAHDVPFTNKTSLEFEVSSPTTTTTASSIATNVTQAPEEKIIPETETVLPEIDSSTAEAPTPETTTAKVILPEVTVPTRTSATQTAEAETAMPKIGNSTIEKEEEIAVPQIVTTPVPKIEEVFPAVDVRVSSPKPEMEAPVPETTTVEHGHGQTSAPQTRIPETVIHAIPFPQETATSYSSPEPLHTTSVPLTARPVTTTVDPHDYEDQTFDHDYPTGADFGVPIPSENFTLQDGDCIYDGLLYVSAQQIPRDDPCDFCFCFRGDIICLKQSCPPPIEECFQEPIPGFCCPRFECPVTALTLNLTDTRIPYPMSSHYGRYRSARAVSQTEVVVCAFGHNFYNEGESIRAASGPCMDCVCGSKGTMSCMPKPCEPSSLWQTLQGLKQTPVRTKKASRGSYSSWR